MESPRHSLNSNNTDNTVNDNDSINDDNTTDNNNNKNHFQYVTKNNTNQTKLQWRIIGGLSIMSMCIIGIGVCFILFLFITNAPKPYPLSNTVCSRDRYNNCKRGTVTVDPWLQNALETQRQLVKNQPLDYYIWLGSHNSWNSPINGGYAPFLERLLNKVLAQWFYFLGDNRWFVFMQQQLSITDQLDVGIRALNIDTFFDPVTHELHVCHAGNAIRFIDKIIRVIGPPQWQLSTMQIGCTPWSTDLRDVLLEIDQWLVKNPEDFLMLSINTHLSWDMWHPHFLVHPFQNVFGNKLFTFKELQDYDPIFKNITVDPKIINNLTFPSVDEMKSLGKRIIAVSSSSYGFSESFGHFFFPLYPSFPYTKVTRFKPYPHCPTGVGSLDTRIIPEVNRFTTFSSESFAFPPFFNGPKSYGMIKGKTLKEMNQCAVRWIALDQVDQIMLEHAVWTWAPQEPHRYFGGNITQSTTSTTSTLTIKKTTTTTTTTTSSSSFLSSPSSLKITENTISYEDKGINEDENDEYIDEYGCTILNIWKDNNNNNNKDKEVKEYRWMTDNCTTSYHRVACRATNDPYQWIVTETKQPFPLTIDNNNNNNNNNNNSCPNGFEFGVPVNAGQQQMLVDYLEKNIFSSINFHNNNNNNDKFEGIWLNWRLLMNGEWNTTQSLLPG